jgi:hypothetical protein
MMGPEAAKLQIAHNDASDAASKTKIGSGITTDVTLQEMLKVLGTDKKHSSTYPDALRKMAKNDCHLDNLPGATRQTRSINVAFSVPTITPNLYPKIQDAKRRWEEGPAKGMIPSNYLELLPTRGFAQSLVRVSLESPDDLMADGKMPAFPANLRKYEYHTIRRNLEEAQIPTTKWAAERSESANAIKKKWEDIFHGRKVQGKEPSRGSTPTDQLFKPPTVTPALEWCPRRITLVQQDGISPSDDILLTWAENNQNMCTTSDGFHPPEYSQAIVEEGLQAHQDTGGDEAPPEMEEQAEGDNSADINNQAELAGEIHEEQMGGDSTVLDEVIIEDEADYGVEQVAMEDQEYQATGRPFITGAAASAI